MGDIKLITNFDEEGDDDRYDEEEDGKKKKIKNIAGGYFLDDFTEPAENERLPEYARCPKDGIIVLINRNNSKEEIYCPKCSRKIKD